MSERVQQRKFYRIDYVNPADCPHVKIGGQSFEVRDLSEEGTRLNVKGASGFTPGASIAGAMHFPDGESVLVAGEILRVTGNDIVIKFRKGFPLRKIMEEQRRLIQKMKKD